MSWIIDKLCKYEKINKICHRHLIMSEEDYSYIKEYVSSYNLIGNKYVTYFNENENNFKNMTNIDFEKYKELDSTFFEYIRCIYGLYLNIKNKKHWCTYYNNFNDVYDRYNFRLNEQRNILIKFLEDFEKEFYSDIKEDVFYAVNQDTNTVCVIPLKGIKKLLEFEIPIPKKWVSDRTIFE